MIMKLFQGLVNLNYNDIVKVLIPYALIIEIESLVQGQPLSYINIAVLIGCLVYLVYKIIRPNKDSDVVGENFESSLEKTEANDCQESIDKTRDENYLVEKAVSNNTEAKDNLVQPPERLFKKTETYKAKDKETKPYYDYGKTGLKRTETKSQKDNEPKPQSRRICLSIDDEPGDNTGAKTAQAKEAAPKRKLSLIQSINQDYSSEYARLLFSINKLEELEAINNPLDYNKIFLKQNQFHEIKSENKEKLSVTLSQISKMRNLKEVIIQKYELEAIPFKFTNLRKLKELDLSRNKIASLPVDIQELTSLEKLILKDNQLNDFPLSAIRRLKNHQLRYIDVSSNANLSQTVKDELKKMYQSLEGTKQAQIIID